MRRIKRLITKSSAKTRRPGRAARALLAAAAAIPILSADSFSQELPKETTLRFQYSYYKDWQAGDQDRIRVNAPMALITAPIAERTAIEAGGVLDSVSGASPVYHDTLSGASGIGIDDRRVAGDVKVTQFFDRFSLSLGGAFSTEDDYDSRGANLSGQIWSEDKNTTFLVGTNYNHDSVGSSNNPDLDELRRARGFILGVTQVLDKDSLIQANLSYQNDDGYLDDPYKTGDRRPSDRDKYAWVTRYIRYLESLKASLHADYRLYGDSWGITSHTIEFSLYQPLNDEESWLIRPRLRYYSQDNATFYREFDPIDITNDKFYTADERLSAFGSVTAGIKLIHDFGDGYQANIGYDFTLIDNALTLFSSGSPDLRNVYLNYFSLGLSKKF